MTSPRQVVLPRWHSGRWLLSPEILTAYDEIWIHPEDVSMIKKEAALSSYNEWEAYNFEVLRERLGSCLIVKEHGAHYVPGDEETTTESDALISSARPPRSRQMAPFDMKELLGSIIHAHKCWIKYNEQKLPLLHADEPLRRGLERDLIPNWRNRIRRLSTGHIEERFALLRDDSEIRSTFMRLVGAAQRLIEGSKSADIYDYLAPEYIPMISVIERRRLFESRPMMLDGRIAFRPILSWQRIVSPRTVIPSSLEEWIERIAGPRLEGLGKMKDELAEIEGLLAGKPPLEKRNAKEIREWCRELKRRCEMIDKVIAAEKNLSFWLGFLAFVSSYSEIDRDAQILLRYLGGGQLVRSALGVRDWWEKRVSGLLAATMGITERTGRLVSMVSNSLLFAKGRQPLLSPDRYLKHQHLLDNHFWPYVRRLEEDQQSRGKGVP